MPVCNRPALHLPMPDIWREYRKNGGKIKNIYVIAQLTKPELSMLKVVDFYKLKERKS